LEMATGKVIRFDEVRGYGFIAPDNGTEDVFVHANDLLDDKYLFRPGLQVTFRVEDGERGLKASDVRIIEPKDGGGHTAHSVPAAVRPPVRDWDRDAEDGECDLLSPAEFRQELTEALLEVSPTLTGEQILQIRQRLLELARAHSWVES
jgi:cold shock protein